MEFQQAIVSGKPKMTYTKHGHNYTRKGYDIRVDTAEKFKKKCNLLGDTEGRTVEKLIEAFVRASGWGQQVKQPPFLEPRSSEHVKEAVERVVAEGFPWLWQ